MACAPATCPPPAAMVAKKISGLSALRLTQVLYQPPRSPVPAHRALQALVERDLRPPPQRLLRSRDVAGPRVDGQVPRPTLVEDGIDAGEPARLLGHTPRQQHHGRRQAESADPAREGLTEALCDVPPGVAAGLGNREGPEAHGGARRCEDGA